MARKPNSSRFVKSSLKKLGWKQVDLAFRLEVTKETVSRWVNGRITVPAYVLHYLKMKLFLKEQINVWRWMLEEE
jgi:transcriptional regulator with XRE-family HTH domain